jgi:ABC-type polysaccharide/polyol phosphate export permease
MAIPPNANLLYHRNVRVIDLFLTRSLLEIGGASMSFVILSTIFTATEWMSAPMDLLLVAGGWLLLAWFGAALALVIGAATAFSHIIEKLWHPVSYLLFPLSGAGSMVDWLPKNAQDIVLWLPMVHGVEMLRDGYFGTVVTTHYDIGYLCLANLVLTFVGLMLVAAASRRVEVP